MLLNIRLVLISLVSIVILHGHQIHAAEIYWYDSDKGHFQSANRNGSDLNTILTIGMRGGAALDPKLEHIYFNNNGDQIIRMNLDGTSQAIFTDLDGGRAGWIAVDLIALRVYWYDSDKGHFQSSNLDGTGLDTIVSVGVSGGTMLDSEHGHIYFNNSGDQIMRMNVDGTDQTVYMDLNGGRAGWIGLDQATDQVLWYDSDKGRFQSANRDGTDLTTTASVAVRGGIVWDSAFGHMYFNNGGDQIIRMKLDGSDQTVFMDLDGGRASWIALIPEPTTLGMLCLGVPALLRRMC